jgi:general secretion pathway protein C
MSAPFKVPAGPVPSSPRRLIALVLLLVAACAAVWGGRILFWPVPSPAGEDVAAGQAHAAPAFVQWPGVSAARAEATPEPGLAAARFRLDGVVAPSRKEDAGIALIAVDNRPARAFRVGDIVDEGIRLDAVSLYGATLAATAQAAPIFLTLASPAASAGLQSAPDLPAEPAVDLVQDMSPQAGTPPGTLSKGRRNRLRWPQQ